MPLTNNTRAVQHCAPLCQPPCTPSAFSPQYSLTVGAQNRQLVTSDFLYEVGEKSYGVTWQGRKRHSSGRETGRHQEDQRPLPLHLIPCNSSRDHHSTISSHLQVVHMETTEGDARSTRRPQHTNSSDTAVEGREVRGVAISPGHCKPVHSRS